MKSINIQSKSNPWVQQVTKYQQKTALRKAEGWVWLEGEHLVLEAISRLEQTIPARYTLQTLVLPDVPAAHAYFEGLLVKFPQLSSLASVQLVWLNSAIYRVLCEMDSMPLISGIIQLNQNNIAALTNKAIVVLDGVQDPGNVGTIVRLCAAFGVGAAYLSKGSASAWGGKAVRAGQGAQLALNIVEDVDLLQFYRQCMAEKRVILATSLSDNSRSLDQIDTEPSNVWVFGHEGQGISEITLEAADQLVHIPMQGGFESLNVASAAAICLWHWQSGLNKSKHNSQA